MEIWKFGILISGVLQILTGTWVSGVYHLRGQGMKGESNTQTDSSLIRSCTTIEQQLHAIDI